MIRSAWLHGTLVAIFAFLSSIGSAQEYSYQNAYIHYLDGEISLQRAANPETEPGELNTPILPGDRLWTHPGSRVEIRFSNGTVVRLDEGTKVDFVAFDSEPTMLLWNGSAIVKVADPPYVRIDTPAGSVAPQSEGTYRIDVRDGSHVTLTVRQGVGEIASTEGSTLVRSGETSGLEAGTSPEPSFVRVSRADAFDVWSDTRDIPAAVRRDVPLQEVPDEVDDYVDELSENGEWRSEEKLGYVWYPSVSIGWAPYRYGHWGYTHYGYTWISYEPWGWAPYHYGRWGYNHHGWYWVPGRYWGPAWVSFAIGPTWIGWSPLGHHGGPVYAYNTVRFGYGHHGSAGRHYRGRRAVPRDVFEHDAGWNFERARDFGKRTHRTRLRGSDIRGTSARAKVHSSGAILDRNLTPHAINGKGNRVGVGVLRRPRTVPLDASRALRSRPRSGDNTIGAFPTGASPSRTSERRATRPRQRGTERSLGRSHVFRASPRTATRGNLSRSIQRARPPVGARRAAPRTRSAPRRQPTPTTGATGATHPTRPTGVRSRAPTRGARPSRPSRIGSRGTSPTRARTRGSATRPSSRHQTGRTRATVGTSRGRARTRSSGAGINQRGSQRTRSSGGVRGSRGATRSPSRGTRSSGRGTGARSRTSGRPHGNPRNRN